MKFEVFVTLKKEVLDPQGKAIENALKNIGFRNIETVRQGKYFSITINEDNISKAEQIVNSACKKLLSNETIEEYKFKLIK